MTQAAAQPRATSPARRDGPYARLSPAERYIHETRDQALFTLLGRHGIAALDGLRIIEIACGNGSLIGSLVHYGARPRLIEGIDVDRSRAAAARKAQPGTRVLLGDAAELPYRDASFDVAFAFTAFSSMLDDRTRSRAANEALRVLRPGGLLVVYDFRVNPTNPATRPLRERELRSHFGSRLGHVERLTLAPPVVRMLGGRAALCRPLERFPWLRTHLLAAVRKEPS